MTSPATDAPLTSGAPTDTSHFAAHKYVFEFYFSAGVAVDFFNDDKVVFSDFILFTTGFDDSEHDDFLARPAI